MHASQRTFERQAEILDLASQVEKIWEEHAQTYSRPCSDGESKSFESLLLSKINTLKAQLTFIRSFSEDLTQSEFKAYGNLHEHLSTEQSNLLNGTPLTTEKQAVTDRGTSTLTAGARAISLGDGGVGPQRKNGYLTFRSSDGTVVPERTRGTACSSCRMKKVKCTYDDDCQHCTRSMLWCVNEGRIT